MWQDWYFAVAGLLYSVALIPSMRDPKTELPRTTSVLTAVALSCSALTYGTLVMWWAATATAIGAATWAWLARYRPIRVEQGWRMLLTDEREIEFMEKYREFQQQQRLAHQRVLGGCGACPSAGDCSEPEA